MAWGSSFDKVVKPMQDDVKGLKDPEEMYSHNFKPSVEWPNASDELKDAATIIYSGSNPFPEIDHVRLFVDIGKHNNKVPTHDPYTNPNAHIYYECKCGQILDPGTKRFAELNNCASNAGWKIRFSDTGYIPYCVDCGKGVE